MSWLRDRVEAAHGPAVRVPTRDEPWVPPLLSRVPFPVLQRLTYAVLDEQDEPPGEVSFVLTPWPRIDDLGRVRHDRDDPIEVGVAETSWRSLLAGRRLPEVLRERPPRIGDVFAVMLLRRDPHHLLDPIGPVVDVTADARDAARSAFYGAVAPPLDQDVADAQAAPEDDGVEPLAPPDEWAAFVERKR